MTASWDFIEKPFIPGGGGDYDEVNLDYDQDIDPDTMLSVKYDGFGQNVTWTNTPKP